MSTKWYDPDDDAFRASLVVTRLGEIRQEMITMRKKWRLSSDMYLNTTSGAEGSGVNDQIGTVTGREGSGGLESNMIARCVDTVVTMLIVNRSRCRFVTDNADDIMRTKAVDMTQYCDAVQNDQRYQTMTEKILRDGCLYGTGWLKVWPDDAEKKVKLKPIPLDEINVSSLSGLDNRPSELLHRYIDSREKLMHVYADQADEIELLGNCAVNGHTDSDAVEVIECFKSQPWIDGDQSGRHCIVLGGSVTVLDEPWPYAVPFIGFRYKQHQRSFFGTGIADMLMNKQLYINTVLKSIAMAAHRYGHAKLLVKNGTTYGDEMITDEIGAIVEWNGDTPPVWSVPNNLTCQELQNMYHDLMNQCYDECGINEMASSGMAPKNLHSGKAIAENNDVQSVRLASVYQSWDQFHIDLGQAVIQCAKRVNKKNSKVKLRSPDGSMSKKFWRDVDLEEDSYTLQAFSVSMLPITPQGRLDFVDDLQTKGFISPQDAHEMMGSLDVSGFTRSASASKRAAMRYAQLNLDSDVVQIPDEFIDLNLCMKVAEEKYNDMIAMDEKDEIKCERLKNYLTALADEISPPQDVQSTLQQGIPGTTPGVPTSPQAGAVMGPPQPGGSQ